MDPVRINTLNDLIMAVCQAIQERDPEMLEAADRASRDWMVCADERCAINTLIDTADEAINELA